MNRFMGTELPDESCRYLSVEHIGSNARKMILIATTDENS
jgi:hypothetical protein